MIVPVFRTKMFIKHVEIKKKDFVGLDHGEERIPPAVIIMIGA